MLSPLISLARLVAIAHRGGSALRPENTLAAFDLAVSLGVDAIECDVHLSRDDVPVVIHDPMVDRTTDGSGPVGGFSAAELEELDAGFHFQPASGYPFRGRGVGVPTLDAVLGRYPDHPVIIEIKGERPATADRVLAVIRRHDADRRVIIGGFSHKVLAAVRQAAPHLVTSASSDEARRALQRAYFRLKPWRPAYHLFQMPFRLRGRQMFGRAFVRAARRARLPVQAWIIDDPHDMRRLIEWGVTGIISDRPDIAVELVRARPRSAAGPTSGRAGSPPPPAAP